MNIHAESRKEKTDAAILAPAGMDQSPTVTFMAANTRIRCKIEMSRNIIPALRKAASFTDSLPSFVVMAVHF